MANVKISELPAITTPTTADLVPVVQSGVTDKITRGNFLKNVDADMTTSDVTTNDVTSTKHGFAPKSPADATKFLNGAATPAYALVKDSDLSTSDITTNDASITKHGFLKKLDNNSAHFLDGQGNWSTPTGYTDEQAQDAVGTILDNGTVGDVNFTYDDATPKISGVVKNASISLAKIANASANSKLLGSGSAGSGSSYSEITLGSGLSMTGTTLSATATGGGTETRRIPVQIRSPQQASNAGNAFFNVQALTNQDFGCYEFVKDVVGNVFGVVSVPPEADASPNAKIILIIAANATSGVTSLNVSTKCVAHDAESINVSFTDDTEQDITVPGTAYLTKKVTFSAGDLTNAAPNDIIFVKIQHHGTAANDTLAVNTLLVEAYLEVDVTPA